MWILALVEPAGEPSFSRGSLCGRCIPDDAKIDATYRPWRQPRMGDWRHTRAMHPKQVSWAHRTCCANLFGVCRGPPNLRVDGADWGMLVKAMHHTSPPGPAGVCCMCSGYKGLCGNQDGVGIVSTPRREDDPPTCGVDSARGRLLDFSRSSRAEAELI